LNGSRSERFHLRRVKKGGVKDVQGVLGHSKADTTVNVYMQQIEAGVKQTLDAIYVELTAKPEVAAGS